MNIPEKAAIVLQQINARIQTIAISGPEERLALRLLKTAIEDMLRDTSTTSRALTTLCDQWKKERP